MEGQTTTTVEVQDGQVMTVSRVADGIQSGSWAVLLFLLITFLYVRKPVANYLEKQNQLLDTLKDTLAQNSDTLQSMAATDARTAETLSRVLQHFSRTAKVNRAILDRIASIESKVSKDK